MKMNNWTKVWEGIKYDNIIFLEDLLGLFLSELIRNIQKIGSLLF